MLYANITTRKEYKEFLKAVDAAETWDAFEPEEYRSACEFVGLDFDRYTDPDELFRDLKKMANVDDFIDEFFKSVDDDFNHASWACSQLTEYHAPATNFKVGEVELFKKLEKDPASVRKEISRYLLSKQEISEKKLWFAVMKDREDTDHGYGSHDLEEAEEMCREMKEDNPDAYIAVIDPKDDFCVEEIEVECEAKYRVKDEFVYNWTNEDVDELIVTKKEIEDLAKGWAVSVEELMEQVEEV